MIVFLKQATLKLFFGVLWNFQNSISEMLSTTAYLVKQINYFSSSKNFLVIDSNPWHLSKQNRSWTKSKVSSLHGLWIRGSLRSKISWLWAHKIIDNQDW